MTLFRLNIIIFSAMLIALVVTFYEYRTGDAVEVLGNIETDIEDLQILNHRIDQRLAGLRASQMVNFDPMIEMLETALKHITAVEKDIARHDRHFLVDPELDNAINGLRSSFLNKESATLRLISSHAVLQNSLTFYNQAITRLATGSHATGDHLTQLFRLSVSMSRFLKAPDTKDARLLDAMFTILLSGMPTTVRANVEALITHGRKIIEVLPAFIETRNRITKNPFEAQLWNAAESFQNHHLEHAVAASNRLNLMFALTAGLLLSFGFFLINMHRARVRLATEVAERTQDLDSETRERQIADQKRVVSDARYRELFENSVEGIVMTTAAGLFIRTNPAYARMMGYDSPEDLIDSVTDIGTEIWVDTEERRQMLARLDRDDQTRAEVQMRRKDGSIAWIAMSVWAGRTEDGKLAYINAILEDISQRREMADELETSEDRFRQIAEISSDWVWEMDAELRFSYFSEGLERILGIKAEINIGKRRQDVTPAAELTKPHWLAHLANLEAHRAFRDFQFKFVTPTGDTRHLQVSGTPIFDTQGSFHGYRGTATDVTRMVRTEQALKTANDGLERQVSARTRELEASRNHLRQVTDAFPALISHLDQDLRFTSANKTCAEWYDLPQDQIVGKLIHEIHGSGNTQNFDLLLARTLGGETVHEEITHTYPDGITRDVNITYVPDITGNGHVVGFFALVQDVTDRSRTERMLIQSDKLATLGRMAAGISHELSQPLNIIRLAAQTSIMEIDSGERELGEEKFTLQQIDNQVVRMAEIIEHMSIFARDDKGPGKAFMPRTALTDALSMVTKQFAAHDIQLDILIPPSVCTVEGSAVQLEQVLLNLLSNARDALDAVNSNPEDPGSNPENPGTAPRMGVARRITVELNEDQGDNQINIAIADNAGGIPDDIIDNIFDPFFTTKDVGSGTGLGLYVSYTIIETMGGGISVRNVDGGARFEITLPCLVASEAAVI